MFLSWCHLEHFFCVECAIHVEQNHVAPKGGYLEIFLLADSIKRCKKMLEGFFDLAF